MPRQNSVITTRPEDLQEGLFGQIFLWIFEILPYLHARGARPDWDIRSLYYGAPPERRVIPGVLDLAYAPAPTAREVSLLELRDRHCSRLGDDWERLGEIWSTYFRIPKRIEAEASSLGPLGDTLGVHYRGTDKNINDWDTNPVSHDDFVAIIEDFRSRRPHLKRIFVATDDNSFAGYLGTRVDAEIINLGDVEFHKAGSDRDYDRKADRALLDCVLLSRCAAVLKTSSALSGFTKILRPELEIYRCAASKLFTDVPYFPVAYIPRYESDNPELQPILARLMKDDWTERMDQHSFVAAPRSRRAALKWKVIEALRGAPV